MSQLTIDTAFRLPTPDVEALTQGRSITILSQLFLDRGKVFALYPDDNLINLSLTEQYYSSSFLPTAQKCLSNNKSNQIIINAWAKCELCEIFDDIKSLEQLSALTIWKTEGLTKLISQRPYLFLTYVRVYLLPKPREIPINAHGKFISLSSPLNISDSLPVLSDRLFTQRRYQLENRLPPQHPELENLQTILSQKYPDNPLKQDLDTLLGWSDYTPKPILDNPLNWITEIAKIGNSSDGHSFEKLVRKSLIFLGFKNSNSEAKLSLDPEATGGAGGLDFYCEFPYPVVGECKATKTEKVPDGTPAQLVKLGNKHLQQEYNRCIKIIMAAGELTKDAELTASGNKMNVIRPETLQRLVELKAKYPGSIDLLELKPYLEEEPFGEAADAKVNHYIDQVWKKIKLRSHIVTLLKNANKSVSIEYLSGAYDNSNPTQPLTPQAMHEILLELSSPLTGYLGREKGREGKGDQFYFLRDLPVDQ